jgi:TonB family protein
LAGGIVLLVGVVVGVVLLVGRSEPTPSPTPTSSTPTPTPQPRDTPTPIPVFSEGVLVVDSQPPGATVTVNGENRGQTPLELTGLPAGIYQVKVERRGYGTRTETLVISAESPRAELAGPLSRTAPATGTADVFSTPLGATVTIDGAAAGVTPLTGVKLKPGSHAFEFAKSGYERRAETVTIEVGRSARVDVALKALPRPATPTPDPNYVDTDKVYLDSDVDVRPKKLSGSASYPDNAPSLKSGQSVSVELSFVVTETGEITDVKLLASSGNNVVDEAVLKAVARWKYAPGSKKGVKVKVRVGVRQTFRAG